MRNNFFNLFDSIMEVMRLAVSVIISLAVMGFLWGIVKILFNPENQVAKKEGREYMFYGVLTLFVMTSVWALVGLIRNTFIGI